MPFARVLLLLGGEWHDFTGFASFLGALVEPEGWLLETAFGLERLNGLADAPCDLVVGYTCFTRDPHWKGPRGPAGMTDRQVKALADWVGGGGAFLAAHAATVAGESGPRYVELIGGEFVEHPPAFSFTVHPVYGRHPITEGIQSFTVHDELYIERLAAPVDLHMVAVDRGTAYPMVWSRREGKGRVAHVAPGHAAETWENPSYRRLMLQTMRWLIGR